MYIIFGLIIRNIRTDFLIILIIDSYVYGFAKVIRNVKELTPYSVKVVTKE